MSYEARLSYVVKLISYKKIYIMKRNLHSIFTFLLLGLPFGLVSQVTITNSIFPVVGDTLQVIASTNSADFDASMVGADQVWDLTSLSGGAVNQTRYVNPSEGDASDMFPDADLLDNTNAQEIYYKSFNNKVIEIGRSGLDPVLNLIDLTFSNEGEAVLRRAPMSFGDVYGDESSFTITSATSAIPDSLFPGISTFADSLRLTVTTDNDDEVDAWGALKLPSGDFDVIRLKRTTTTFSVLEARVAVVGWLTLDESSPFFDLLGDLGGLLGETVTTSYQFYANDNKEVMANVSEDADGNIVGISYKGDMTTSVDPTRLNVEDILTYPNPTYGNVTFNLQNLPQDNYKVVLHNIIGKQLWSEDVNKGTRRLEANLSFLRKGTYLYSIVDGNGHKISTRRLMIITP